MKLTKSTIGIIGGGAMATSLLANLAKKIKLLLVSKHYEVEIIIFEKSLKVGSGVAFGTSLPVHCLNTRNEAMGVFVDNPMDFVQWLDANPELWQPIFPDYDPLYDSYAPRGLFAKYLEATAASIYKNQKNKKFKVTFIQEEVIDLDDMTSGGKIELTTAHGENYLVDYAVLAIGNLHSNKFNHLNEIPNFFSNPWQSLHDLARIPKSEPVIIIGTGLTAIDTALSLKMNGHFGPISLVSRNGYLPKVQPEKTLPKYKLKVITLENLLRMASHNGKISLKSLELLLWEELKQAGMNLNQVRKLLELSRPSKEILSEDILAAQKGETPWQPVLYALSELIPTLWHHLSYHSKGRFSQFSSKWAVFKHPFILKKAIQIQNMLEDGQMEVLDGFKDISYDLKRHDFTVFRKGKLNALNSKYIVNGIGIAFDLTKSDMPLIRNLLNRTIILPHLMGGCYTEFRSGRVHTGKGISDQLFAVGSLTRGVEFYVNAFSINIKHVGRISEILAEKIATIARPEQ